MDCDICSVSIPKGTIIKCDICKERDAVEIYCASYPVNNSVMLVDVHLCDKCFEIEEETE